MQTQNPNYFNQCSHRSAGAPSRGSTSGTLSTQDPGTSASLKQPRPHQHPTKQNTQAAPNPSVRGGTSTAAHGPNREGKASPEGQTGIATDAERANNIGWYLQGDTLTAADIHSAFPANQQPPPTPGHGLRWEGEQPPHTGTPSRIMLRGSRRNQRQGAISGHPLRIATHNMRGLLASHGSRLQAAVRQWAEQRLDVVCLQETHHTTIQHQCLFERDLRHATTQIHTQNWKVAAYSWSSSTHTAGVLILIRQGLASALAPKLASPQPMGIKGRFTDCILHWGGHRLHICNIYLPPGTTSAAVETRRQLFENALAATTTQAMEDNRDTTLIWAGDFNFVENPERDSSAGRDGRQADRPITEMRQRAGPQMVDTHRYLHPRRRDFTHLYHAPSPGGSRLDRIYINEAMLPYICHTAISFHTASDHRLATLHLLPRKNEVKGPGIKRIHMAFTDHEDLATSMAEWIRNQCQEAPSAKENPGNLIAWWPGFKRRLTILAHQLNKVAQQRRQQPDAHTQEAYLGVQQAQQALDARPHSPHLLQQLVDAQARLARVHIEDNARAAKTRVHWLHAGERPGPALTTFLQTQIQDQQTAPVALQAHSGRLVTNSAQLPQVVADFWAGVCRAPDFTTPEDCQSVLTQLAAANIRLPEEADEVVGSPTIAVSELGFTLKKSQPGKAPGWDGIPTDLYRKFWPEIGHTMAALFTAIGKTGQVPTGFLDGIIKVLYKKGDPKQPGNYCPITLLCSDYRLLAKVLANRLGPALGRFISPEQSAFLPKRLIGASVLFLRHLPHLLRKLNRQGLLAFLDFAKAYDTVDRNFLMGAMEAMGAGPQLCSWTRILLSNTRARAMMNGFKSRLVKMEAGVRQGCPLAPLLYLFVAQALFSWLKSQQIGLQMKTGSQPVSLLTMQKWPLKERTPCQPSLKPWIRLPGHQVNA
ncbi:hypothetical protein VaNZ11_004415 [Volvox africanus]|uniref:Reverse transcriptase domain-containing protein n=1 Tax=Volvox africanus TaxID=51714 RepID=A0ABQ5RXA9_9CHLO|nr:hypothetical protein VaNZ11_004415 [Volvox africanus]